MNRTSRDIPCIDIVKSAWPTFCNNWAITLGSSVLLWLIPNVVSGLVFACMVIACIIFGGSAILQLKLDAGPDQIQQVTHALLPVIGIVIIGIALCSLTFIVVFHLVLIGFEQILLALAGGKPAEVSALFNFNANSKRCFWNLLITNVLATLAIGVGFVFFVIPGLFLSVRFSLAPFLVIDRGYGPVAAMKKSNELVAGYSWQVLLLYLMLNGALIISGLFAQLLPLLVPFLLVPIFGFYGLVVAKIYVLRTDGVELQAPQITPTAGQLQDAYSDPASITATKIVEGAPVQPDGLRKWVTSSRGNEVTGAVFLISILLIFGFGAAFLAGVNFGRKGPAASSKDETGRTTSIGSTQTGPGPISESASAPQLVAANADRPVQPPGYLSDSVPYTNDQLVDRFVRFKSDSPLGQSRLQLELLAPKDWWGKDLLIQKQEIEKGARHPLELAELGCDSPNTSLEAWYMSGAAGERVTLEMRIPEQTGRANRKNVADEIGAIWAIEK